MGKHRENKCDIDPDLFCFIVCNCRRLCGVVLQPCYKMLKCQREVWSSSLTQYYAELNPPGKKKKKILSHDCCGTFCFVFRPITEGEAVYE